jgi:capsular exopolysaccharide synthesis family protein
MIKKDYNKDSFDFQKYLKYLVSKWKIIFISVFLVLGVALGINMLFPEKLEVSTSIMIKPENNKKSISPQEFLEGFQLFSQAESLQDEILVLQSLPLLKRVVEKLDLRIQYFQKDGFFKIDLYKSAPFKIEIDPSADQIIEQFFRVRFLGGDQYEFEIKADDYIVYDFITDKKQGEFSGLKIKKTCKVGEVVEGNSFKFRLVANTGTDLNSVKGKDYYFQMNSLYKTAAAIKNNLSVKPAGYEVSVVDVVIKETNYSKAIGILNGIVEEYVQDKLTKKNLIAVSTLKYIDDQLAEISDSLSYVEQNLQQFRLNNQVMDINSTVDRSYSQLDELRQQKATLEANYKYYSYLNNYINANSDVSNLMAPSSMGIQDPVLSNLTQELIRTSNEKNNLVMNNQGKSPYIKSLNVRIENLKRSIAENIRSLMGNTEVAIEDINQRLMSAERVVRSLPSAQRKLVGIERKYNINDAIYTFLLEKRAEAHIAKASNMSNVEVIEPSRVVGTAFPKKKFNLALAVIVGLFFPAGFYLVKFAMNDTINSGEDLEVITDLPVLGKVFRAESGIVGLSEKTDPTISAESFRGLRTSLDFFKSSKYNRVVLISSTTAGEGKSFVAKNLAHSMSLNKHRTLLVDLDLRKVSDFFDWQKGDEKGMSHYLIGEASISEIIYPTGISDFDFVPSGVIPPNPAELISLPVLADFIKQVTTMYQTVILDSPPIGLLTDAYLLIGFADINLIVVREGVTQKPVFVEMLKEMEGKNLKDVGLVYNDVNIEKRKGYYNYNKYSKN